MNRVLGNALLLGVLAAAACHGGSDAASGSALQCESRVGECNAFQAVDCTWSGHTDPTKVDCAHMSVAACGSYDVALTMGVDTGEVRYFDASTGWLVAVVDSSANGGGSRRCVAGTGATFVEPECPPSAFTSACPGGRVCRPDADACMTSGDCCSGNCAAQGTSLVCCSASGCP